VAMKEQVYFSQTTIYSKSIVFTVLPDSLVGEFLLGIDFTILTSY